MFIDCSDNRSSDKFSADVCIIGSGPAGLTLARTLIEANKTVVIVERGGKHAFKPSGRKINFTKMPYDGIKNGVAFGFGGTGALWGGQLLPMLDSELQQLGAPWSSKEFINELRENSLVIEEWVGVSPTTYYEALLRLINHPAQKLDWMGFFPIFSKWIPFSRRNIGNAWLSLFKNTKKTQVLLNLQPQSLVFSKQNNTSINQMICQNEHGDSFEINANQFVIAAGALESPLVLQKLIDSDVINKLDVGKYLTDHLSLRIAEITELNSNEFEKVFASFFMGQTMRSFRLCFSTEKDEWAYCHFVIEAPENSGFAFIRNFLRGLQAGNYGDAITAMINFPNAFFDLIRMTWMVFFKKRLAISKGSRIFVNLDFSKEPEKNNSIFYNQETMDEIIIDWDINEKLDNKIESAYSALSLFWSKNSLNGIGNLSKVKNISNVKINIDNMYDIYHPAGTCAIGRVVDSDLKVHGIDNAYVVGSAVFPRLGRSNPTLTIMALSRRLGIKLSKLNNQIQ